MRRFCTLAKSKLILSEKENERFEESIMLFRNDIERDCAYCVHGRTLTEEQVACPKKGVMSAASHCRAFQYDPLRRTPPRPVKVELSALKDEDFSL
mgnify:CR=1 FL=1